MSATIKQLAAELRKVWNAPATRPWARLDVAIAKLLQKAEETPEPVAPDTMHARIEAAFDKMASGAPTLVGVAKSEPDKP